MKYPLLRELNFFITSKAKLQLSNGQVANSEISEMSEILENYLRIFHLRVFVLAQYAKVENSEMFGNLFETSPNYLFHTIKAFISLTACKMLGDVGFTTPNHSSYMLFVN